MFKLRRYLSAALAAAVLIALLPGGGFVARAEGDGTVANPFLVNNVSDLRRVGTGLGTPSWTLTAHYRQTANINMTGTSSNLNSSVTAGFVGGEFRGVYDGQGYVISNLTLNRPEATNVGLFSILASNAVVKRVGLVNPNFTGSSNTGGIVGTNNGIIENCYVSGGTISGTANVGGITGTIGGSGAIHNTYASSEVKGNNAVGGLVGDKERTDGFVNGRIRNSVALNPVISTANTNSGGIGRVAGTEYANLDANGNNYALANMTVTANSGGESPHQVTLITEFKAVNRRHGADITEAQAKSVTWWENASNWTPFVTMNNPAYVWDFDSVWIIEEGNYPVLRDPQTPRRQYTITITGGTTDKDTAPSGEVITITANEPPEDTQFISWDPSVGSEGRITALTRWHGRWTENTSYNTTTAKFIMPPENVVMSAFFGNPNDIYDGELTIPGDREGAVIDLAEETITLPDGFTVVAYSVDGGNKWKKGALPTDAKKVGNLFNKPLALWVSDQTDDNNKPITKSAEMDDTKVIKFPAIEARAKTLVAKPGKLVPYYKGSDNTWVLVDKAQLTAAEDALTTFSGADGFEYGRLAKGDKAPKDGYAPVPATGTSIVQAKADKETYLVRKAAYADGGKYYPASKAQKISPAVMGKVPSYKAPNVRAGKPTVFKLKKGDFVTFGSTTLGSSTAKTDITVVRTVADATKEIAGGTEVTIWKAATGKKPASLRQTLTMPEIPFAEGDEPGAVTGILLLSPHFFPHLGQLPITAPLPFPGMTPKEVVWTGDLDAEGRFKDGQKYTSVHEYNVNPGYIIRGTVLNWELNPFTGDKLMVACEHPYDGDMSTTWRWEALEDFIQVTINWPVVSDYAAPNGVNIVGYDEGSNAMVLKGSTQLTDGKDDDPDTGSLKFVSRTLTPAQAEKHLRLYRPGQTLVWTLKGDYIQDGDTLTVIPSNGGKPRVYTLETALEHPLNVSMTCHKVEGDGIHDFSKVFRTISWDWPYDTDGLSHFYVHLYLWPDGANGWNTNYSAETDRSNPNQRSIVIEDWYDRSGGRNGLGWGKAGDVIEVFIQAVPTGGVGSQLPPHTRYLYTIPADE